MKKPTKAQYYEIVESQASLAEAGGLAKPRSVLLLWFLRNVVGLGELEAYDNVCDGDNDKGIDGLYVEFGAGSGEEDTLVILQSKFTESAGAMVGPTDVDRLAGAATHFANKTTLANFLASDLEPSLRQLIEQLDVQDLLGSTTSQLAVRLALVTTGTLNADAKRKVAALREIHGERYVAVWDIHRLGPLAIASRSPERISDSIHIEYDDNELIVMGDENRVAVVPVRAGEVANWPGISDRSLFALNVRHQLRTNKVSKAIDGSIDRSDEHRDFLACHNGLTLVCSSFTATDGVLEVVRPSVVNGAQSVLAFSRAAAGGKLTDELRIFAKVVEVEGRPLLEKEVGRRSNTQTGVNPRNLMANHGTQLRIQREFAEGFAEFSYETRPDDREVGDVVVLKNDEMAQLLCAIFNGWPWLAVKRLLLFESDTHSQVFSERVKAHHVVFCHHVREAVEAQKSQFPDAYRSSWQLTRLVGCFLVGDLLREFTFDGDPLSMGREKLLSSDVLDQLSHHAYVAAVSLDERHEQLGDADQFKKDFKNEAELGLLAAAARKAHNLAARFHNTPAGLSDA